MAIRVLPPEIAGRIAAGEVVERPASVIKELVENALDAGASRISVEAVNGGLTLLRVTDNGSGIAAAELEVAFERHATSKLAGDDLSAIATLGFRGEALPSIAAVAEVEAVSRPADAPSALRLVFDQGRVLERGAAGAPPGTSISVRALFRRQPARLKFLRSAGAEAGQIANVVTHYALAYPEVRFSLSLDGRESFATAGNGRRREAAAGVYGAAAAASMIEVIDAGEGHGIEALVGPPPLSRSNRSYITIFVNRRWVRSRSLSFAVEEAYRGLLQTGRYPVAIVDIRLPPEEVDVNVHPAKAEVRLRNDREVFSLVQRPLRRALAGLAPQGIASPGAWPRALAPREASTGRVPSFERPGAEASPPQPLAGAEAGAVSQPELPARIPILRPLGQAGTTYIIAEGPAGLYLIDQHAAHERVVFERLRAERSGPPASVQGLLAPVVLELTPAQQSLVASLMAPLRAHGFEIEGFGPASRRPAAGGYILRACPAVVRRDNPESAFFELLDLLTREDGPGDPFDRVASSLACHAAVRAGQSLSFEEMRDLLRQLEECELPQTCPHGRPTMLHLSADELAHRFGRR